MLLPPRVAEAREHPRLRLPAMYTVLRVKPIGAARFRWTGHIYDISISGMRFELDEPIETGAQVEMRVMLPGGDQPTFYATGRVIRLHGDDDGDFGPTRMGMTFESFRSPLDRLKLANYLTGRMGDRALAA